MRRRRRSRLVVVAEVGRQDLAITHPVQSFLERTVVSIAGEAGTPTSTSETYAPASAFGYSNSSERGRRLLDVCRRSVRRRRLGRSSAAHPSLAELMSSPTGTHNLANVSLSRVHACPRSSRSGVVVSVMVPEDEWRKHADDLVRLATALVGPSDAEDLVVSAYVRAVTSDQWATVRNERGYLTRSVTNGASNHHRAQSRRRAREQRALAGQSDEHGIEGSDLDALRLIASLSVRQRSIVWMTYWLS